MQEKKNRFRSLCICQRLFDFIVSNLIRRGGFKSVASDHPLPQSSPNKVPADCSKSCLGINNGVASSEEEHHPLVLAKPNHELIKKVEDDDEHDQWDFEIQVHHKETDDNLEVWTPVDNLGSSIYLSDHNKDSTIPSIALEEESPWAQLRHHQEEKEISAVQATGSTTTGLRGQGKESKEAETETAITRSSSATKKMMTSIKELARGEKSRGKIKQGNKNSIIMGEKLTLAVEAEDMETKPPVRQVRPLFNVAMSINEKSDAFIRSRKAAMRGTHDF